MSPLAVENGSLVTSGGSLCETCCSPPPETGACCYTEDGTNWICEDGITGEECAAKPNVGVNFYPGQTCGDIDCPEPPTEEGACCFFDDITQAYACTEGVTADWCAGRTDGTFHVGKTCSQITCPDTPIEFMGACCDADGNCVDGVEEWDCFDNYAGVSWHIGLSCSAVDCQTPAVSWNVDCYNIDNGSADCSGCGAGPFGSYEEANDWVIANPPPPGCDQTIVEVTKKVNPLP